MDDLSSGNSYKAGGRSIVFFFEIFQSFNLVDLKTVALLAPAVITLSSDSNLFASLFDARAFGKLAAKAEEKLIYGEEKPISEISMWMM